jgi:hypothetical protein
LCVEAGDAVCWQKWQKTFAEALDAESGWRRGIPIEFRMPIAPDIPNILC